MSKNLKEKIADLQAEQMQLKARTQQLQSQFNEKERKTTDKRKFVVGALVLKDIEKNAALRNHIVKLLANAPERDKKPFPDFLPIAIDNQAN